MNAEILPYCSIISLQGFLNLFPANLSDDSIFVLFRTVYPTQSDTVTVSRKPEHLFCSFSHIKTLSRIVFNKLYNIIISQSVQIVNYLMTAF